MYVHLFLSDGKLNVKALEVTVRKKATAGFSQIVRLTSSRLEFIEGKELLNLQSSFKDELECFCLSESCPIPPPC